MINFSGSAHIVTKNITMALSPVAIIKSFLSAGATSFSSLTLIVNIVTRLIGIPTALFISNFGDIWGGFEVIAGIFGILAFGMFFSFLPEAMSYIKFLLQRYNYYKKLMRCLKRSNNYSEFRNLMGFPIEGSDIQALLNIEEESLTK